MKKTAFLFSFVFTAVILFTACGSEPAEGNSDENVTETTEEVAKETPAPENTKGKEIYDKHCKVCHQEGGAGLEGAFPGLIGLTVDKAEVIKNIKEGKETGDYPAPMVPVEISDEEADAVAEYVLCLK